MSVMKKMMANRLRPSLVLTTLQCLSASRKNPAWQHASGRQALKRQHIFTLLSAGQTEASKQIRKCS